MQLQPETAVDEPVLPPPARKPLSWETLALLPLILILILGAYFRFTGLNWDDGTHLHPDERFLTDTTQALGVTLDPIEYLHTSTSPLNPYNFGRGFYVYGNFPMTITRLVGEFVAKQCQNRGPIGSEEGCAHTYNGYDGIHLVGRALAGLLDLLSIVFLFLIGRRLYDWRVALLGSLLLAMAVMPIQQSHFYTMDTWAAGLTTFALYTAVRAAGFGEDVPEWRLQWWLLFGLGLGLTVASRINMAPLALVINLSALIWLARRGHTWQSLFKNGFLTEPDLQRVILGVALAATVSIVVFRLGQPYAFTDAELYKQQTLAETGQEPGAISTFLHGIIGFNPQWRGNMEEIQRLQAPEASFPPATQWVSRAPILFPLSNIILYGMGITAGLAAWAGLLWALWRIARLRPDWTQHLIPVVWTAFYFLFMGTRWVKSVRYFLPIYPTLLLLGAWALFTVWDTARQSERQRPLRQALAGGLMAVVVVTTFLWANAFMQIYREPLTRVAASDWMFENVPSGATLLYTADGTAKQLQLPLKSFDFYPGTDAPLVLSFALPEDGKITAVRFNYVSDPTYVEGQAAESQSLYVAINPVDNTDLVPLEMNLTNQRRAVEVTLPETAVTANTTAFLQVSLGPGGPVHLDTSHLTNEHWDDLLPVNTAGRNAYGSYYTEVTGGQRPVTLPDNIEKRQDVLNWLDEADYIMLSSQRAIWSVPRMPLTYPLMNRYYEALFSGELGFKLVGQFHGDIHIGPLYVSDTGGVLGWGKLPQIGWPPPGDLAAEEAFSVYDHPPVWIFAKTADFSHEKMLDVLGRVDLSNMQVMNPLEASRAPHGLMLTPEQKAVQRAGGTFSEVFNPDGILSQKPWLAAIVWWLTIILLGLLAFPILFVVLRGLPDRGYPLARIFALLFVSYFAWLNASIPLLYHTKPTLLLGVAVMGVMSLVLAWRYRQELTTFVQENWRYLLVVEGVSVALYLLAMMIRLGNPDVWDVIWGGEKPMDLAYLTAVMKSSTFPPYDPWLAGGYINYYYYGFVYVGSITKLLGIVPGVAYNLILPMLYSFTGIGAFSAAYNLVAYRQKMQAVVLKWHKQAIAAGLVAAILCVCLGNLAEVGVVTSTWYKAGSESYEEIPLIGTAVRTIDGGIKILGGEPAPIYPGDWFWTASRAINANPGEVGPITEFPFFTFLYGDLHAHMISLPLTLLALGCLLALILQVKSDGTDVMPVSWAEAAGQWFIIGLAIGVLRAVNTWDWPTYLVLGSLATIFYAYRQNGRFSFVMLMQAGLQVVALFALSVLTFWPFAKNYGVGYNSASFWPGSYTQMTNYLSIYGLFLLFIVTHLAREFRAWTRTWTEEGLRKLEPLGGVILINLFLYVAVMAVLLFKGFWIAPVVLTLIMVSGLLGLRPGLPPVRRIILILISSAFGLTLAVEFMVLDGDIGRMNTVFKFYMQVWVLMSVIGGVTAVWAWPSVQRRSSTTRSIWQGALALMVAAALLYPLLATKAKWDIRMSKEAPHTLDGTAFMNYVSYGDTNNSTIMLSYDYEAIQWLQRNVQGSPVMMEGHSHNNPGFSPYRTITNRIAMYTGLPAVAGWDWHQRQQRATIPGTIVSNRINEVNQFYNTPVIPEALETLRKYDVSYVYVGQLEQTYYTVEGILKFPEMVRQGYLEVVYTNPVVTIYKVIQ